MTKDQFRNPDLVLCVLLDRNAVTVILYTDLHTSIHLNSLDVNVLHGLLALLRLRADKSISCVHDDFVKEFVESRVEAYLLVEHFLGRRIVDPSVLIMSFYRADVGIREFQNVVPMGKTLVGICQRSHKECCTGQGGSLGLNFRTQVSFLARI